MSKKIDVGYKLLILSFLVGWLIAFSLSCNIVGLTLTSMFTILFFIACLHDSISSNLDIISSKLDIIEKKLKNID
jgi:hypothetical protein